MGYIDIVNLIMVGQHCTGKTLLVQRYSNELQGIVFDPRDTSTRPTIGTDLTYLNVTIDNKMVELKFWDTAGQERFNALSTNYYKSADGVMLVYDVTDLDSFNAIPDFYELVQNTCRPGVPVT
jgi:Ras-related protein Rab-1A